MLKTSLFIFTDHLLFILAYRAPLAYNLSVARELLKQVYIAERLQPPLNPQTWSDAYTTLAQRARSPNYWREIVNNGEWARVGLYAIEAYTIFKVRMTPSCVFAVGLGCMAYLFTFRLAKSLAVGVWSAINCNRLAPLRVYAKLCLLFGGWDCSTLNSLALTACI